MSSNTVTVKPLPQGTTEQRIKEIFHSYRVNRVHIDGDTAYVEFEDDSDLETLEMTFGDYKIK